MKRQNYVFALLLAILLPSCGGGDDKNAAEFVQVTYKCWDGNEWIQLGDVRTMPVNSPFDDSVRPDSPIAKYSKNAPAPPETVFDYAAEFKGWTATDKSSKGGTDILDAPSATAFSGNVTDDMTVYAIYGEIKDFVYIEKGEAKKFGTTDRFQMHHSFIVCDHEVTQAEYTAQNERMKAMNAGHTENPSHFNGSSGREPASGETQGNRPVENVTWFDAVRYCNALSEAEGLDAYYEITGPAANPNVEFMDGAKGYRLLDSNEWEYAACGGVKGRGYKFSGCESSSLNVLKNYAWYAYNNGDPEITHEVGKLSANELGLYDMSGNVYEWTNTTLDGSHRVSCGGSYQSDAEHCAIDSRRTNDLPSGKLSIIGFRVARSV